MLAIDVGWLIGGIVVVETVFSYPGLGRLLLFAIERHDLPLIQASILVVAAIYCVANLVADLLYAYFNPKIRYGALLADAAPPPALRRRRRRLPATLVWGVAIVALIVVLAAAAPWIAPYPYDEMSHPARA